VQCCAITGIGGFFISVRAPTWVSQFAKESIPDTVEFRSR
jgi:hypothetical protein